MTLVHVPGSGQLETAQVLGVGVWVGGNGPGGCPWRLHKGPTSPPALPRAVFQLNYKPVHRVSF